MTVSDLIEELNKAKEAGFGDSLVSVEADHGQTLMGASGCGFQTVESLDVYMLEPIEDSEDEGYPKVFNIQGY